MSVSTEILALRYDGNGSAVDPYLITFPFLDVSEIYAAVTPDGVAPPVNLGPGDYTVTRDEGTGGGTLTTAEPVELPARIVIYRHLPLIQPTEFQFAGPFPSKSSETSLDRLLMQIQQVNRRVSELAGESDGVDYVHPPVGPPETQRDVKVWNDGTLRGTVLPQWVGQLGVELSTQSLWIAQTVAVGSWLEFRSRWQLAFLLVGEGVEVPLGFSPHLSYLSEPTAVKRLFCSTSGGLTSDIEVGLYAGAVPVGSVTLASGSEWAEAASDIPDVIIPKGTRMTATVVNSSYGTGNRHGLNLTLECLNR